MDKLQLVEREYLKDKLPEFQVGDTVGVHVRILEGDKERIQVFTGTVIARSGRGINEMFTVRRIVAGEGVERTFPLHSPSVVAVEVKRRGRVRRAKLYYLRDRVGKATKVKELTTPVDEESTTRRRRKRGLTARLVRLKGEEAVETKAQKRKKKRATTAKTRLKTGKSKQGSSSSKETPVGAES
ncbi:MAG: hypothetical protein KatS3mg102_0429 [Planctomycetota bacterium]|nr:MAG: hypothetical protein KatS3mg102_0429 [Planctomycetota bacterium]